MKHTTKSNKLTRSSLFIMHSRMRYLKMPACLPLFLHSLLLFIFFVYTSTHTLKHKHTWNINTNNNQYLFHLQPDQNKNNSCSHRWKISIAATTNLLCAFLLSAIWFFSPSIHFVLAQKCHKNAWRLLYTQIHKHTDKQEKYTFTQQKYPLTLHIHNHTENTLTLTRTHSQRTLPIYSKALWIRGHMSHNSHNHSDNNKQMVNAHWIAQASSHTHTYIHIQCNSWTTHLYSHYQM